jgi:hypothetical protein
MIMSPNMERKSAESLNFSPNPGRGKYSAPQMFEYGTLREITLTVGRHGMTDHARDCDEKCSTHA